jgi:hypothetical protein
VVVFGSGYVLLAFLRRDLADGRGWLDTRQVLDGVIAGQITPGPVFTTATFLGYLLGGVPAAMVSTAAIFAPSSVMVAALEPLSGTALASQHGLAGAGRRRHRHRPRPRMTASRATSQAVVLGVQVGAPGPAGRLGDLAQAAAQPLGALAGPPRAVLAGRLVIPRAHPRPRGQMRGGGELAHVRADLGHDDLGGTLVDPGDGVQQRHLLGVRGDHLLDPRRQHPDGLVQVVDVGQDLGDQQPVMVGAEPSWVPAPGLPASPGRRPQ